MQKSNMLIHESHIAEHGEISNTSPIASSRPIGLVRVRCTFLIKKVASISPLGLVIHESSNII